MLESMRHRFGEIAVWLGLVKKDAVQETAAEQAASEKRIGELLEEKGHLQPSQTDVILRVQQIARKPELPVSSSNAHEITHVRSEQQIHLFEMSGCCIDETDIEIPRFDSDGGVLVLSLGKLERINNCGVVSIWGACGGINVVLCELTEQARFYFDELGVSAIVPVTETRDEAMIRARELVPESITPVPVAEVEEVAELPVEPEPRQQPTAARVTLDIEWERRDHLVDVKFLGELLPEADAWAEISGELQCEPTDTVMLDLTGAEHATTNGIAMALQLGADARISVCGPEEILQKIRRLGLVHESCIFMSRKELLANCDQGNRAGLFVGVQAGSVYHSEDCALYQQSLERNRIVMTAEEIAVRKPCGRCLPF